MADTTHITWCDRTMNFWIGCTKISAGCTNCYAAVDTFARRERSHGRELWGPNADRHRTSQTYWQKPYQWNNELFVQCDQCGWRGDKRKKSSCPACGNHTCTPTRQRVFVGSLMDICEEHPQITQEWRNEIARIIVECENIDWLFLTKRPEKFNNLWTVNKSMRIPDHVWIGTTIENQEAADRRIPELMRINAKTRFLSCEPLLGNVDLKQAWLKAPMVTEGISESMRDGIHWVIAGGESGKNARPMHPAWARSLRDQCAEAGIPFHFKQWGEWFQGYSSIENPTGNKVHKFDDGVFVFKIGKRDAGRKLSGVEHLQFPEVK